MTASIIRVARPRSVPDQVATRLVFLVAGVSISSWAPLVPYVKTRTQLDDAGLGLLLLCLGAGSIVAMPLTGALVARLGCRTVLAAAASLVAATLPFLAVLSSIPLLVVALAAFGAAVGAVGCAANVQALAVERAAGRSLMSGFHGMYSLGGILGAVGMSGLYAVGTPPLAAAACADAVILLAMAAAAPHLLSRRADPGPAFAVPRGVVLAIGLLCLVVYLTEGSVLDWGAVFLVQSRGLEPAYAGLGYAAFALAMTVGRLGGDALVDRFGGPTVVMAGGTAAGAGLVMATLAPAWEAALLGFAMVGAGCANIVPVMFAALGRQTAMPADTAVPAVSTLGYAGVLLGPAGIGLVAHATSLTTSFLILAVLLFGVAAGCRMLRL